MLATCERRSPPKRMRRGGVADAVGNEELPIVRLEHHLTSSEAASGWRPWGYATLALAAWRSGDAAAALEWSQLSLGPENSPNPRAQAYGLVLQAMAQHKQGETEAARESLAEAIALIDPVLEQIQPDALPSDWHDWLIPDILRQEAEGLLSEEEER